MGSDRGVRERTGGRLGWRLVAVAGLTAVIGHFFAAPSRLPGSAAALFALAVLFALGGCALHFAGDDQPSLRRDVLLGLAAGTLISAIGLLVW